jgi:hypothetical protein
MVLKMQHGSTKKLCRRNTHNFLSILKKTEAKNARLHFWEARVLNHISEFLVSAVERNKRLWLELLLEGKHIA